jgi:hypothetical protein
MLIFWKKKHTHHKNAEAVLVVSKEDDVELNSETTNYIFMSCEQNARQNYCIKVANKSLVTVAVFIYFGMKLTSQNYHHHHHLLLPWIRLCDLFRHQCIATFSWGIHDLFSLEVCS